MSKMLAILLKSLNVLLSRMYNVLCFINQEASLSRFAGGPSLEALILRGLAQVRLLCEAFPSYFPSYSFFLL